MALKRADTMKGDFQVGPRFADVADEVAPRTMPHELMDILADEEGKGAYVLLFLMIVSCIVNSPLRLIMDKDRQDGRQAVRSVQRQADVTAVTIMR